MKLSRAVVVGASGLLALWIGWGAYVDQKTQRVTYETLDRFDGVEIRQYPRTVLAETTAADSGTAFRRLFRYITGENEGNREIAMTAPVATRSGFAHVESPRKLLAGTGERVPMTAPVRSDRRSDTVTMGFFLPSEYTLESAPTPTNPRVRLVVEPPRTTAVSRFSWYAAERRVNNARTRLLDQLDDYDVDVLDEPVLLQYDDPWTPPFMRTNEIEVPVDISTLP